MSVVPPAGSGLGAAVPPSPRSELRLERRVEFSDTDMEGIIHFSRFFIFMETAEHRFLNALGSSVAGTVDGVRLGWPRLAVGFEFLRPVRFEDELAIRIFVLKKGTRSLTYGCEIRHRGELVARGQSTSACCAMEAEGGLHAIDIPDTLARRIEETAPEEKASWRSPIRPL